MKKVGAGFKKQGAKAAYIAIELDLGVLGHVRAMIFENSKKTEPHHPDYSIMIPDDDGPKPQAKPRPQPSRPPVQAKPPVTTKGQPYYPPSDRPPQDEIPWPEGEFG